MGFGVSKSSKTTATQSDVSPGVPKTSWPEVVGMDGDKAKAIIEKEFPGKVYLMGDGMFGTADWDTNRVWIHVTGNKMSVVNGNYEVTGGTVRRTPQVG